MKVEIRPLIENDAKTSVHWRNDPEVWRHTGSAPDRHITLDMELEWIRRVMADPTSRRFAILADGHYVGNIYLTGLSGQEGEYHIFIGDKGYWGKGVAKLASQHLIEYARNKLKLILIKLQVKPSNVAAIALYHKLGFMDTGQEGEFIEMKLTLEGERP